jgi:hypothetical protein
MNKLLAVAAVLSLIAPFTVNTASAAPWCIAMPFEGGALQCRFSSLGQCNATASGIGGECYQNPGWLMGALPVRGVVGMAMGGIMAGTIADR